jgi:hypothetical protein
MFNLFIIDEQSFDTNKIVIAAGLFTNSKTFLICLQIPKHFLICLQIPKHFLICLVEIIDICG